MAEERFEFRWCTIQVTATPFGLLQKKKIPDRQEGFRNQPAQTTGFIVFLLKKMLSLLN